MQILPLMPAVTVALRTCLAVRHDEMALVVSDTSTLDIARAFLAGFHALGADATLSLMTPRDHSAQEPPPAIAAAMAASDVIVIPTCKSLTHTHAVMNALKARARVASLPGITAELMTDGSMTAEYERISARSWALNQLLEHAEHVELTSPSGTELTLSLAGRRPQTPPDDGLYRTAGTFGNLPAGESYIAPVEGSAEGMLVIDGSMAPVGLLQDDIRITLKEGRAVSITGGAQARAFQQLLEDINDPGAWMIGELGIGTNDRARLTGNVLEDEKVMGTVHLALGMNLDFGGAIDSCAHHDGVLRAPTLVLDGRPVIEGGRFLLSDTE